MTVLGIAGNAWYGDRAARARVHHLMNLGVPAQEAVRRAVTAHRYRTIWGMFWIGWGIPLGCGMAALAGRNFLTDIAHYVFHVPQPAPEPLPLALAQGTDNLALFPVESFGPASLFVSGFFLVLGWATIYGFFLCAAHISRMEMKGVEQPKTWWKLYKGISWAQMKPAESASDHARDVSGAVLAVIFFIVPVAMAVAVPFTSATTVILRDIMGAVF